MRLFIALPALLLALALFHSGSPSAWADDAQALFDSLYGPKVKAAQQSADRADDVAVAKELLQGAALVVNQPALITLICDAAYNLGKDDAAGHDTAIEAMQLLAKHVHAREAESLDRIGDLLQKQFTGARGEDRNTIGASLVEVLERQAAIQSTAKQHAEAAALLRRALNFARLIKSDRFDAIKNTLDAVTERQRLQARIDKLAADVSADPGNQATVTELVMLHIVDLDEPAEAGSFLLLSKDETLKKRVQLAGVALADVKADDARDLGEWYASLANQAAATPAKRRVLSRALLYLNHFLAQHTGSDLSSAKAKLMLNSVTSTLDKLGGPVAVNIPGSAAVAGTGGATHASGGTGAIDLSKLKPVAMLTADKSDGIRLVEARDAKFTRETVAGRRAIVMNDVRLHVSIDAGVVYDLSDQRDKRQERWFVRFIAHHRMTGFAGLLYDGLTGIYPPNGDGVMTNTPWARVGEDNQWAPIDVEVPHARFANRQEGGADFAIHIGPQLRPFHVERIELYRIKLPPVAQRTVKPGDTVDLLKLVTPQLDTVLGEWKMFATGLRCRPHDFARIGLPILVRGSYDMQVKFTRAAGNESVNIMLPVGPRHAACIIDGYERRGHASGLETIGGKLTIDNPAAVTGPKLTTGKRHTADIRVRVNGNNAQVEVDLDGQSLIRWAGSVFQLTGSAWRLQDTLRPGLGGFNTPIEFSTATLKMIDGDAELLTGKP